MADSESESESDLEGWEPNPCNDGLSIQDADDSQNGVDTSVDATGVELVSDNRSDDVHEDEIRSSLSNGRTLMPSAQREADMYVQQEQQSMLSSNNNDTFEQDLFDNNKESDVYTTKAKEFIKAMNPYVYCYRQTASIHDVPVDVIHHLHVRDDVGTIKELLTVEAEHVVGTCRRDVTRELITRYGAKAIYEQRWQIKLAKENQHGARWGFIMPCKINPASRCINKIRNYELLISGTPCIVLDPATVFQEARRAGCASLSDDSNKDKQYQVLVAKLEMEDNPLWVQKSTTVRRGRGSGKRQRTPSLAPEPTELTTERPASIFSIHPPCESANVSTFSAAESEAPIAIDHTQQPLSSESCNGGLLDFQAKKSRLTHEEAFCASTKLQYDTNKATGAFCDAPVWPAWAKHAEFKLSVSFTS